MKNGFIVFVIIGIGFIFFASDLMRGVEDDPYTYEYSSSSSSKNKETIHKYLRDSPSGEKVFDPSSLTIEKTKELWGRSSLKANMMGFFPKFKLMKKYAKIHIVRGEFLDLIIQK